MTRTPLSEASGPAAPSPRLPCPPGPARFPGSGGPERRRSPCRCRLHLRRTGTESEPGAPLLSREVRKRTHASRSCGPGSPRAHTPPANQKRVSAGA